MCVPKNLTACFSAGSFPADTHQSCLLPHAFVINIEVIRDGRGQTLHFSASCGNSCAWMVLPLLLQHKLSLPPLREGDWGRGWGWGLDISWCSGKRLIWLLQRGNVFLVGIRRAWRSNRKAVKQQIVLDASSNNNSDNNNS